MIDTFAVGEHQTRSLQVDEIQSSQYGFPYHYIPSNVKFPNFARNWGFAASYIAAIELVEDWLTLSNPQPGHRHMDFGCGDGGFVNALAARDRLGNVSFSGIDFDANAIRWAEMFSVVSGTFRARDIATLPEKSYDSGTLIEVFEHVPPSEGDAFVEAISRALKPSAPLFVTVPSTEKPLIDKHYRHFDFDTISTCFMENFTVEEVFGFEKRTPMMRMANRLMRNGRIYMELKALSRLEISQLAQKHDQLAGAGRIGLLLRKK
ncbi:2-polyprenyl-3-methyl-5-hydroxy-6-metoxy-1,4-benzoquinol methylase [Sagittula marina]|uniref:2-polyprenyl-3-methyl-5-hydroxy-6-metoxy-1, 4-benzoquinol methylase n=2 Tax=Sagittula marina TaxID=943940 RepID=A0A7W6GWH8_9RHOB|nr:class I SAM-dependent methyltransferase [Sagittula marina]MBB3988459.1 2-polyprenyl-3-methyl-5-hydroxy-6-metoxy-1,4-benzoquinol methylase [Sagittula marina]